MKKIIESYDVKSLVVGSILGGFFSIFIFSALVPSGPDMIRVYNMQKYRNMMNSDINVDSMNGMMNYSSEEINSEKDFVEEMIQHHSAAVAMSRKVIGLNPSEKIKDLALSIIKGQTGEIQIMKDWLVGLK